MFKTVKNFKILIPNNICSRYCSNKSLPNDATNAQPCDMYSNSTPPRVESISCDMIGPPHPVSNLRPVVRHKSRNETSHQEKLRKLQNETQLWNQSFWECHNSKFTKERDVYIEKHSHGDRKLNADEMSDFYKEFLDKNWKTHVRYNWEWYKRNFTILFLSIRVNAQSLFRKS